MSQIHTQGSHFWRLLVTVDFEDGFNTKIWSGLVYHSHVWSTTQMVAKLEKWPISSYMSPAVTMISARDASASEKIRNIFIQSMR